jgi:hypothetical protein
MNHRRKTVDLWLELLVDRAGNLARLVLVLIEDLSTSSPPDLSAMDSVTEPGGRSSAASHPDSLRWAGMQWRPPG